MPDVFITPGSSTVKFVDSGGTPHNITINGYTPDQIQFTGSVISGNPLLFIQDSTTSTLLPGASGYGLGSATNRWNMYATALDISGNISSAGSISSNTVVTSLRIVTTNTTLTSLDSMILGNATLAITLPAANTLVNGQTYNIRNVGTGNVTITGTIGPDVNPVLLPGSWSVFVSNGTSYYYLNQSSVVAAGIGLTGGSSTGTLAVDQSFSPTWTGTHTFSNPIIFSGTQSFPVIIGSVVTNGTPNSVLFVDSTGKLNQNNASLYWDNTNLNLNVKNVVIKSVSAPTSPVSGQLWSDGTDLYYQKTAGIVYNITATTATKSSYFSLFLGGSPIANTDDTIFIPLPYVGNLSRVWTFRRLDFRTEISPVGGNATVNIKLNGTLILSSYVAIIPGSNSASVSAFTTLTGNSGDLLTVSFGTVNSSDKWGVFLSIDTPSGSGGGGMPVGTTGQTLYYNSAILTATSNFLNNGTQIGVGITPTTTDRVSILPSASAENAITITMPTGYTSTDIILKDAVNATDHHITTTGTGLVLTQTGDVFGTTSLLIGNRTGMNGALFSSPSIPLIDFVFNATGTQRNIRFEARTPTFTATGLPEFQIGGTSAGPSTSTLIIGDHTMVLNAAITPQSTSSAVLLLQGLSGQTGDLLGFNNPGGATRLASVSSAGTATFPIINATSSFQSNGVAGITSTNNGLTISNGIITAAPNITTSRGVSLALMIGYSMSGINPSTNDVANIPVPYSPVDGTTAITWTIKRLDFRTETAPSGGAATVNVNLNGVAILASALSIPAASKSAFSNTFGTTTCHSGDLLQIAFGTINSSDLWGVYVLLQGTY